MKFLKQLWELFDDRTGIADAIRPIALHPVPPGTGWSYVLGSATLLSFVIQVITGIGLATVYVPATNASYESLQFITNQAPLGNFLRGLHFFGASAMVVLIALHVLRVFLSGSFKFPREVNWMTGSILLLFTLAMAFTGQLLRWDQNGVWSTVLLVEQTGRVPVIGPDIGHFILGGDTVGATTLSRFFAYHVFFIPAMIFAFLGFHLYLVLRNGISEPPRLGRVVDPKTYRAWYRNLLEKHGEPFWPDVIWRDIAFGFVVLLVIVALALVIGPPALNAKPDPANIHATPRPDWYFAWLFAVFALMPPGIENAVMVLAPVLFGAFLFLLPIVANRGERNPLRRPWAVGIVFVSVVSIAALEIAGLNAPWSPDFGAQPLPAEVVGATSGPVFDGAQLFYQKGCEYCHAIAGNGGHRGPDLTYVGDRLTADQMVWRMMNGGTNMPSFASTLKPAELDALVAFLQSRTNP